jgi:hypothetical protein
MNIEDILHYKDLSILAIEERDRNSFVVAAPHHAPLGVKQLPCPEHTISDENTGFLGAYTAQLMDCPFIVACNYFIDSNKNTSTDYFKKITGWEPSVLVELHGHGGDKAHFDIEISSGNQQRNHWSEKLAHTLGAKMRRVAGFEHYDISGDYNSIYFTASKSLSINTSRWLAFHLEIPYLIRAQSSLYEPFCEMLAESLTEMFPKPNQPS